MNIPSLFYRFSSVLPVILLVVMQACESDEAVVPTGFTGIILSSGEPVASASVSLSNNTQEYSTLSEADGHFRLNDVVSGEYILTVKSGQNDNGFMQFQKNVTVSTTNQPQSIELPKGVTLLDPANISDASVDLKWTKSGIINFLEYKLYRHTTSGLDETTGTLVHVATNADDTVFTDTELLDNENYYYRVFVRNTFGLYGGSNILEVTTLQGNYVSNGNFEEGLSHWELYTPNPCVEITEDPTSPRGSKVLKAEIADQSKVNISSELVQTINHTKLISGSTHTLSFWAKVEALTGNGVMYVKFSAYPWYGTFIKLNSSSAHTWTEYSIDFIAPNSDVPYSLFIYAEPHIPWNGESFKVLLDGIELHKKR